MSSRTVSFTLKTHELSKNGPRRAPGDPWGNPRNHTKRSRNVHRPTVEQENERIRTQMFKAPDFLGNFEPSQLPSGSLRFRRFPVKTKLLTVSLHCLNESSVAGMRAEVLKEKRLSRRNLGFPMARGGGVRGLLDDLLQDRP